MKVSSTIYRAAIVAATVIGVAAILIATMLGLGVYPPATAQASAVDEPKTASFNAVGPAGLAAQRITKSVDASEKRIAHLYASRTAETLARVTAARAARVAAARRVVRAKPLRASSWSSAKVSWYGPGFYGNCMAGGGRLYRNSMVVAHRSMKFGTRIQFVYKGRSTIAIVRDRGPYIYSRQFDLGPGTAKALGFQGVGTVKWRILH